MLQDIYLQEIVLGNVAVSLVINRSEKYMWLRATRLILLIIRFGLNKSNPSISSSYWASLMLMCSVVIIGLI